MNRVLERLIEGREAEVIRRGGEIFLEPALAADVVRAAAATGTRALGLEGFLVDDGAVYPALSRIADASGQTADDAARWLVGLLEGPWADPPTAGDQLHSDASGRHMVVVVLDEGSQGERLHLFERDGEWWAECLLCREWAATGPDRSTVAERFGRHLQHDPPHAAR